MGRVRRPRRAGPAPCGAAAAGIVSRLEPPGDLGRDLRLIRLSYAVRAEAFQTHDDDRRYSPGRTPITSLKARERLAAPLSPTRWAVSLIFSFVLLQRQRA